MQFLNYDNEKPIECGFDRVKGGWQMRYFSVAEMAKKWDVSERSVRNYCAHGRVPGAFITGKTWNIPENAKKPERSNKKKEKKTTLLVFCWMRRQINTLEVFIIRHRLI